MVQYVTRFETKGSEGGRKIKVLGVDPGFSATDIIGGDREGLKKMGAREPSLGGGVITGAVRGERDGDTGRVVDENGVVAW